MYKLFQDIGAPILYGFLRQSMGIITAAIVPLLFLSGFAIFALSQFKESFDKDLNYNEE